MGDGSGAVPAGRCVGHGDPSASAALAEQQRVDFGAACFVRGASDAGIRGGVPGCLDEEEMNKF